jgi:N utilization substance protein A
VREVLVDDDGKQATVVVPDDQLALAIGRDGQNARLAAKLTGWRVDIKSETEFSEVEQELEIEEAGEADGRCAAVLSAGRRCPNAALSGSRYCGLPQHQALARFETNHVTVLAPLSEEEVAKLADADADESELGPLIERAEASFAEGEEKSEQAEPAEAVGGSERAKVEEEAEEATESEPEAAGHLPRAETAE